MLSKNTTLILAGFLSLASATSQSLKTDSIVMGAGYANEIFYDLNTGTKTSSPVANWDIAHTSDVRDNCIRVNHMNGIEVYYYPKSDGSGWSSFDTTGWKTWNKYYNDNHDHKKGALNYQSNPPFGIGWGNYNTSSHETVGDSLYLLAWYNGKNYTRFMKFQPVKQKVSADLIFRYADVDGNNEVQDTLFQSEANSQNYKYYSFKKTKPVREPANSTWDITFNHYYSKDEVYFVMGVESNRGTKAAKISGPSWNTLLADSSNILATYGSTLADDLGAIGAGWKYFDLNNFKYFLADTQSFVVKSVRNADSLYWLIHFTGYDYTIGKTVFDKMLLGKTNAVHHPELGSMSVYPVPAANVVYVVLENSPSNSMVSVVLRDLQGRNIRTQHVPAGDMSATAISVNDLPKGNYIISVESNSGKLSQLIQIQ